MTRPKVPEERRQRIAQACDTCKRRKQKCNGLKPCGTCLKRSSICQYTPGPSHDGDTTSRAGSVTKRRNTDEPFDLIAIGSSRSNSSISTPGLAWSSPMGPDLHYVGTEQPILTQQFHGQDNPRP
uniref:Zn(2)-C6 fungal-type domain-containing protein n=1 Tax=Bionectria ochroleuca TaxID=29856 RepID=A0A8H7NAU8_BIOOC